MPNDSSKNGTHRSIESEALQHQVELRKRSLGNSFHGPLQEWCRSDNSKSVKLLVNPSNNSDGYSSYSGCVKYANCPLIPESARWKSWNDISNTDKAILGKVHCDRAYQSNHTQHISEKNENQFRYNPFNIRSQFTESKSCSHGGCITPEKQRDAEFKLNATKNSPHLSPACPFFYIHSDSQMDHSSIRKNPLQFSQCYVLQPQFRSFMKRNELVVVAPVYRSPEGASEPGDAFWYPFYSGYSALQLPAIHPNSIMSVENDNPNNPTPSESESLNARWTLTRLSRDLQHRSIRRLPIARIFEGAEIGELTTPWERNARLISVSEGQASLFMLQWLILKRALATLASTSNNYFDITTTTKWTYTKESDESGFYDKLKDLESSGCDLNTMFGLANEDKTYVRYSSLDDDLRFLGLIDDKDNTTDRVNCIVTWLAARLFAAKRKDDPKENSLDSAIERWSAGARDSIFKLFKEKGITEHNSENHLISIQFTKSDLYEIVWISLLSALSDCITDSASSTNRFSQLEKIVFSHKEKTLNSIKSWLGDDNYSLDSCFGEMCRLVPELHILVRSSWNTPLRWLFVPISDTSFSHGSPKIYSGLIVMMKDDIKSVAYQFTPVADVNIRSDQLLTKLFSSLPVLTLASELEGAYLQEQVVWKFITWETNRNQISQAAHEIRDIRRELSEIGSKESLDVQRHLALLESLFQAQLTPFNTYHTSTECSSKLNAIDIAEGACSIFNETFWGRRYGLIQFIKNDCLPREQSIIYVKPLEEAYDNEDLSERSLNAMINLVLDGLIQRARHCPQGGIRLQLVQANNNKLGFRITTPTLIGIFNNDGWCHPKDDLSDLPVGRGFHNLFANAVGFGATDAMVKDDLGAHRGIIEFLFNSTKDSQK